MSHLRIMEGASPPPLGSHSWLSRVLFLPLCICLSDHFVAGGLASERGVHSSDRDGQAELLEETGRLFAEHVRHLLMYVF